METYLLINSSNQIIDECVTSSYKNAKSIFSKRGFINGIVIREKEYLVLL